MSSITKKSLWLCSCFLVALSHCTTAPKPRRKSSAKPQPSGALNLNAITSNEAGPSGGNGQPSFPHPPTPVPASGAAPAKKTAVLDFTNNCTVLVKRFAPYYKSLILDLSPATQAANKSRFDPILAMKPESCQDQEQLSPTLMHLRTIATSHQPCVGLILPMTGSLHKASQGIVRGLRAAYRDEKPAGSATFEQVFRLRDSSSSATQTKNLFANLTLIDQCGLILGGLERGEASQLIPLAQGIQQPLLLLSSSAKVPPEASAIFTLFPTEARLAQTLVQGAIQKSAKKIAILRPSHGRSDRLVEQFKIALQAHGGTVVEDVVYTAGQFEGMQSATRKLFRTDIIGRENEYREAVLLAKKRADLAKEKFNPKMVLLKPQVNFDALFIPDDFRTARHLIKLIKYHMVSKLLLIGNHEWRSQGLLTPPEPFLDGAFFADFVPRYDQLPSSLPVALDGSPYFAMPNEVGSVDFQLIGYHIGKAVLKALSQAPKNRLAFVPVLNELSVQDKVGLPPRKVFDAHRQALWPTYSFTVVQGALQEFSPTVH